MRGSRLDIFALSSERKRERRILAEYEETLDVLCANLTPDNYERALALARWPEPVRGFGHVKEAAIARARADAAARREAFLTEAAEAVATAQAAE